MATCVSAQCEDRATVLIKSKTTVDDYIETEVLWRVDGATRPRGWTKADHVCEGHAVHLLTELAKVLS